MHKVNLNYREITQTDHGNDFEEIAIQENREIGLILNFLHDIEENILAVAANYDGYYLFDVNQNLETGYTSELIEINHTTGIEMDPNAGDNRAEEIHVSIAHNSAIIVDRFDKIIIHKLSGVPYLDSNLPICVADVWLSLAFDDTQEDTILFYPLVKHNSAIGGAEFDAYSASVVISEFCEYDEFEIEHRFRLVA